MKYVLPVVLLSGCVVAYLVPQPTFVSRHPYDLFGRATQAVNENCGGVHLADKEAQLVVSKWTVYPTDAGVLLSQCLVTMLEGDLESREVRVTFSVRKCGADAGTDLTVLERSCPHDDQVPEGLYKDLTSTADKIEAFLQ